MRLSIFAIILFTLPPAYAFPQNSDPVNQTDNNGKKTGYWIRKEGNIKIYEGFFKDDHPVGEFKRYNRDNTLISVLFFSDDGRSAEATFYHPNGLLASKGKYINQRKEGLWKFYSAQQKDYLICEEEYSGNMKNGPSVKYFPGEIIAEKVNYLNDSKQGEWIQYYPNGVVGLKSNYVNGRLNGKFEVWFDNGKIEVSGYYKNDKREDHWIIYREDGTKKYELDYVGGFTRDSRMRIDESNYIDSLGMNINNIPDPEQTGELW